jgi:hypothetical protein
MARTTRSSTQQESQISFTKPTKKRKRISELDDLPPTKQIRPSPSPQSAGDTPIDKEHAQKILDILEMYFNSFSFLHLLFILILGLTPKAY